MSYASGYMGMPRFTYDFVELQDLLVGIARTPTQILFSPLQERQHQPTSPELRGTGCPRSCEERILDCEGRWMLHFLRLQQEPGSAELAPPGAEAEIV